MTEFNTIEVPCTRSVAGAAFASGLQDYTWSIGAPYAWIPSQSYLRVELVVYAGAGTRPALQHQLALAENCVANAFTAAYLQAGSQNVSSLSQYTAQASALEMRQQPSYAMQKSIGQSALASGAFFTQRCATLSSSGAATPGAPTRFAQDVGTDEIYRQASAGNYSTATVSVALTTGIITGVTTTFDASDAGNAIVINGVVYSIVSYTSATAITVLPVPPATVAATTNWYLIRRKLTSGLEGRNSINLIHRPSYLGIFNSSEPMGSGQYRLQLSPNVNFRLAMCETANPDFATIANSYDIQIRNVTFYAAVAKMSIPDSIQTLALREYQVLSQAMPTNSGQFQFTVYPSTYALTVCIQSTAAGNNPAFPMSRFIAGSQHQELTLTSLNVTYGGLTRPATRWLSGYTNTATDSQSYLSQLYYQSQLEGDNGFDRGGTETEQEWMERGPYYSFRFVKDESNRATEVMVQAEFTVTAPNTWDANTRIFLIAEYYQGCRITHAGGNVTLVQQSIG
jgi:hypothetical protein